MSVRDMKGNPGIWEKLSWAELSSEEKEFWTHLGWQKINGIGTKLRQAPIKIGRT